MGLYSIFIIIQFLLNNILGRRVQIIVQNYSRKYFSNTIRFLLYYIYSRFRLRHSYKPRSEFCNSNTNIK